MVELIKPKEWKTFIWAAIVFSILFIAVEIVPSIMSMNEHEYGGKVISKSVAEQRAIDFAEKQTGFSVASAQAVHQADKLLSGYLAKEKLLKDYEKKYDRQFPVDTFQVNIDFAGGQGYGFVYVHMYNEQVTGWNLVVAGNALNKDETRNAVTVFLYDNILEGKDPSYASTSKEGDLLWNVEGYSINGANLTIVTNALSVNDKVIVTKYKPAFIVPDTYKEYVKKQDSLGGWMSALGYGLMSFVLGILAIVYAILYRKNTSFTYGIILTVIFFITFVIMNVGIMDGVIASQGEARMENLLQLIMIITAILIGIAMAGSVYFSIVAGDGLWKAQGKQVWPRLKDPGYGDYVWRSMGLSYLFALIMLGLQPLIFLGLEKLIGTWGASDVTMSPYNMSVLWLMPVLAWAAAISEEAVFRFFGIGLFRRWFRHTFAAMILPTLFWALGHVTYPFYPATTRLFELMIIGLLFSVIFVKYGFITAMFTHAIFNSVAVGSSLVIVGGSANITSAVFFILLPVLIAYILKVWSKQKGKKQPTMSTIPPLERQ